jgi:hypothetical protein
LSQPSDQPKVPAAGSSGEDEREINGFEIYAHNKSALKGWNWLCANYGTSAQRSYDILRTNPRTKVPGRYYELRHKNYAGKWCHEVTGGSRLYFSINDERREVIIYYAGPHPNQVPIAPDPEQTSYRLDPP